MDHLPIAKHVVQYLKRSTSFFLYYRQKVKVIRYKAHKSELISYINLNYTINFKNRKFVIEFFFNKALAI